MSFSNDELNLFSNLRAVLKKLRENGGQMPLEQLKAAFESARPQARTEFDQILARLQIGVQINDGIARLIESRGNERQSGSRGSQYTPEEARLVVATYPQVHDEIHERSAGVIALAAMLYRPIRSVENQLLGCRGLERGEYGRNKVAEALKAAWLARSEAQNSSRQSSTAAFNPEPCNKKNLYPAGLLRWAGHRDGGVRKPFRKDSGRPTGMRITTPLVSKLQTWVKNILNDPLSTPRTLLLVGGPGNGKTDAIETCIEFLDAELKANGKLVEAFAAKFDLPEGQLPPRKVVIETASIGIAAQKEFGNSITLVQDATEGDPAQHKPAEQLLLEELIYRSNPRTPGIYLCCVNRGILAHAATLAQETILDENGADLLNQITAAVTSGPTSPQCWPLKGFEHLAVWPMDVESLVDSSIADVGNTVAHQILAVALDKSRWSPICESAARCPFCQNREILSQVGAVDALVKLLRYYELASGKRWTFRDLFSLVPYLLVGDYSELEIRGRQVTPCEWSAHQIHLVRNSQSNDPSKYRAPYLLISRLYHHRLFPRWPELDRGSNRKAKTILQGSQFNTGLDIARDFFRYLSHTASQSGENSGEILNRVRGSLGEQLDPAVAPGNTILFFKGDQAFSTDQIEEHFSLSVREGLSLVSHQLETLERDLLNQLAEADEALVEENFQQTKSHLAKALQMSIRQFCARLVKRSLGGRRAVCRDTHHFEKYEKALHDPKELLDIRRHLKKLLHDDKNQFRASLVTTFGQPIAQRSRDVVLLTPTVSVRELVPNETNGRPTEPLPYLKVDIHIVPLTFPLFKALREVVAGLHDASLPSEIFALLNGIKSLVSGHLVRNADILDEESRIEIGNSSQCIEISGNDFHVIKSSRQ